MGLLSTRIVVEFVAGDEKSLLTYLPDQAGQLRQLFYERG